MPNPWALHGRGQTRTKPHVFDGPDSQGRVQSDLGHVSKSPFQVDLIPLSHFDLSLSLVWGKVGRALKISQNIST